MQMCRTKYEKINQSFKKFKVIGDRFCREVAKHGIFTHAIFIIVELRIMDERSTFFIFTTIFMNLSLDHLVGRIEQLIHGNGSLLYI